MQVSLATCPSCALYGNAGASAPAAAVRHACVPRCSEHSPCCAGVASAASPPAAGPPRGQLKAIDHNCNDIPDAAMTAAVAALLADGQVRRCRCCETLWGPGTGTLAALACPLRPACACRGRAQLSCRCMNMRACPPIPTGPAADGDPGCVQLAREGDGAHEGAGCWAGPGLPHSDRHLQPLPAAQCVPAAPPPHAPGSGTPLARPRPSTALHPIPTALHSNCVLFQLTPSLPLLPPQAIIAELTKLGASVEEGRDYCVITPPKEVGGAGGAGGWGAATPPPRSPNANRGPACTCLALRATHIITKSVATPPPLQAGQGGGGD